MMTQRSKAQTLKFLDSKVSFFTVPQLLIFNVSTFLNDPTKVINEIESTFFGRPIVVRSSSLSEDGLQNARAGEFASVLNISADNFDEVYSAINTVIDSYGRSGAISGVDEFFVQEFLTNTTMSGVVFTHELNTGAPYYVINYDDVSGLTNTVTSGGGEYSNRTLYIHRGVTKSLRSERFLRLLCAIEELEHIVGSQFLDIEFAMSADYTPYLLQVRAITTQPNWNRAVSKRIDASLEGIQLFVKTRLLPMTGVYGKTTVLGQMPDWNPAEMIGRAPRALAFSLYKFLITDHAWRNARETMGYSVPVGQPLMISLAGQPFIDTRLSFHSYLPASLAPEIGEKLVNEWIRRLKANPELHDKVEFEVAITTFSFDLDSRMDKLIGPVLSPQEREAFREALRQQTLALIDKDSEGSIAASLAKVELLAKRQLEIRRHKIGQDISAIFPMLDDCIRYGTVPFGILARHGFIARTILMSLAARGVLSQDDVQGVQASVRTVASALVDDMRRLQLGELSEAAFMAEYGHLRPGTYDILSRRYDQIPDFCRSVSKGHEVKKVLPFALTISQKREIDKLLLSDGFTSLNAEGLIEYIKEATIAREYSKFVFTRSVSEILEVIARFGDKHGLSREEMSHITISNLVDATLKSCEDSIEEMLRGIAEVEAERHSLSVAIRLPQVLFDEAGVHIVPFQVSHPNFITGKKITAKCIRLMVGESAPDLTDRIVLIENADPGFDWIFAQKIGGLITKYGGANSHMAIRCAEFGIPAAIGCGEQRFESFTSAHQILLDCAAGLINPLL